MITQKEIDAVKRVIRMAKDGYVLTPSCPEMHDIQTAEKVVAKIEKSNAHD